MLVKRVVKRQQQGEREAETPINIALNVDKSYMLTTTTCGKQYSNPWPSFVNSSFQCNQPSGATHPSMVYARPSFSQYCGGSSHAYGGFQITFLQLCSPLVRLCYGCSQTLKPGGMIATPPPPPNDLVIMTRMNRQYRENTTGEMRSKERNVYFHLNVHCIRRKQPYFTLQIANMFK